jgi:TetR/AcrR family transcriptional regulator
MLFFVLTKWLNYMVKDAQKDSTEAKILHAAKKVFVEKGMSGARMQDIADQAGINKALLHYYFRTKEKLFDVIFKEAASLFFPRITGIVEAEISLFEKIEGFCTAYIDLLLENPYLPLFVLSEANKEPQRFRQKFWKNREVVFGQFMENILTEIKNKRIKPVDPRQLFMNMISMCVFPFVGKPVWMMTTGMSETEFILFVKERKKIIPQFIIASIKK